MSSTSSHVTERWSTPPIIVSLVRGMLPWTVRTARQSQLLLPPWNDQDALSLYPKRSPNQIHPAIDPRKHTKAYSAERGVVIDELATNRRANQVSQATRYHSTRYHGTRCHSRYYLGSEWYSVVVLPVRNIDSDGQPARLNANRRRRGHSGAPVGQFPCHAEEIHPRRLV